MDLHDYHCHAGLGLTAGVRLMTKTKMGIIFLAIVIGIPVVTGLIGTLNKVISTPGRVINKTLETDNVIQSYEWFYDVNASYDARTNQIKQYRDFMSNETDKDERYRMRTELAAMQDTCRQLATKYNANSEKMNKKIFKGWALPSTLSINYCN